MREDEAFAPQRVVGLVMQLLKEIREQHLQLEDVEILSDDLIRQGYTENEINAAISWVFSRLDGVNPSDILYKADSAKTSFRVLHPAEKAVIQPDAYGALLEMLSIGMISAEDTERIIERAMAFGGPLDAEEIHLIVHSHLFEGGSQAEGGTAMHFIPYSNTIH